MAHYKNTASSTSGLFEIVYGDCTSQNIANAIDDSFIADGYSVKTGDLGNRTYVKGNRVARLLLGAFYKYFEFHVGITDLDNSQVQATVRKTSSGMSGGLIGVNQVKKELARIESKLMML